MSLWINHHGYDKRSLNYCCLVKLALDITEFSILICQNEVSWPSKLPTKSFNVWGRVVKKCLWLHARQTNASHFGLCSKSLHAHASHRENEVQEQDALWHATVGWGWKVVLSCWLAFPSYCELLILMSRLCAHLVIDQFTLALLVTFPYLRSKWTGQDIHSFQTSLRYSVSKQPAKTPDNHCSVGNTHVQIAHTYTSKFISLPRLYFLGFFLSLQT